MQLATKTTYPIDRLLEDWRWLLPDEVELVVISKFGDAFVRRAKDGAILWLNVAEGVVEQVAPTLEEFQSALTQPEQVNDWFMSEIVEGQAALGMEPGTDECLSYKHPPVLGGCIEPENFEVCDIAVHFSIAGQVHRQVKDLPPGTKIGRVHLGEPTANKPWWRFWGKA